MTEQERGNGNRIGGDAAKETLRLLGRLETYSGLRPR
jgi:hypothetical protein